MSSIFDSLLDDDYDNELAATTAEISDTSIEINTIPKVPRFVKIIPYDELNNLLDPINRITFRDETIYEETKLFTRPQSTTITMEGNLSNVSFHEQVLIHRLIPNEDILVYDCNFGKHVYDGYVEPVKTKTSNRGRKKKEKKKKPRKKQGTGLCFNSQVTCVLRSKFEPVSELGLVSSSARVYKFKIFRTGKIQLPGVQKHDVEDVIACAKTITDAINDYLHPDEIDPAKLTNIININPVMKNHKFCIVLPPKKIIDLSKMRNLMQGEMRDDTMRRPQSHPRPPIYALKYTREHTKLSIKFRTPIFQKPKKNTRINIFMRGKINILGAFDALETRRICTYLEWIFQTYYYDLIVSPGGPHSWEPTILQDNILAGQNDALNFEKFKKVYTGSPCMTDIELADILNNMDRDAAVDRIETNKYLISIGLG